MDPNIPEETKQKLKVIASIYGVSKTKNIGN